MAAWLAVRIPVVFPNLLLGFGWGGKALRSWYVRNGAYKLKIGDKIELRRKTIFGFGLRPAGVVVGYQNSIPDGSGEDLYVISMTADETGDWDKLVNEGWVPPGVTRAAEQQLHSKWNVEYLFRKQRRSFVNQFCASAFSMRLQFT